MSPLTIVLIILALTIIAFVSGKVPFTVISLAIIVALIETGIMTTSEAFAGMVNKNTIMIAAMFVVSAGISKSGILESTKKIVLRYRDRRRIVFLVLMFVAIILSVLSSAVGTMAILLPLIYSICNDLDISRSKMIYPIAVVANVATASTFLGQGAANMNWSEVMMNMGASTPFTIWDFTIARIPFIIAAVICGILIEPALLPDIPNSSFADNPTSLKEDKGIPKMKQKIAIVISVAAVLGMLFLDYFNIVPMYIVALVAALLLVITGVLTEKEAILSIHAPTIFLFVGVMALSTALNKTGAAEAVAGILTTMLGGTKSPYVIMAVFFIVPLILTQLMNNAASIAVFVPLICSVAISLGIDPRAGVMGVIIASTTSILTPMSCNCQAMIMGPGGYKMKDYLKAGTPLVLIDVILAIVILPILYPFY